MTKIGIGITTHNRYDVFSETLAEIKRLAPAGAEIVVVDDASDKPVPEATYRFSRNVGMASQVWDRMDASIEVSREDRDNFVKNMLTILCEERLALAHYRPKALIKGTFQQTT